uniref:F-box/LRR-repeat protein 16 n=1 Tax=Aceria tosichella TaxID=561515 RepID=A0A6G1SLW2_9ACAR
MDSCQIFNFLFGTRKATSELRKCFSGTNGAGAGANHTGPGGKHGRFASGSRGYGPIGAENGRNQHNQPDDREIQGQRQRQNYKTPTSSSPFKQIQLKLANLAAGGSESSVSKGACVAPTSTIQEQANTRPNTTTTTVRVVDTTSKERTIAGDGGGEKPSAERTGDGFACGIFEAQLVRLVDDDLGLVKVVPESRDKNYGDDDEQQPDSSQLDENNNNMAISSRAPFKVIVENPANRLDNLKNEKLEEVTGRVEKSKDGKQVSSQQRINVYDNPLIARNENGDNENNDHHEDNEDSNEFKLATTHHDNANEPQQPKPAQAGRALFSSKGQDKIEKSERVRNLVQSFEISTATRQQQQQQQEPSANQSPISQNQAIYGAGGCLTPRRLLRPPDTPPKSNRAKCLNLQLSLRKPSTISGLFQDENFLVSHFFDKLAPIDRCAAAQVCRRWRNILYADKNYWKDLVGVIDCTHLRREHLAECILNTLQTARLKYQQHYHSQQRASNNNHNHNNNNHNNHGGLPMNLSHYLYGQQASQQQQQHHNQHHHYHQDHHYGQMVANVNGGSGYQNDLSELDQDEIWRIQELCNRYTMRSFSNGLNGSGGGGSIIGNTNGQTQALPNRTSAVSGSSQTDQNDVTTAATTLTTANGTQHTTSGIANSKSSSSQISSSTTLSSISISSLLSPLSESSRIESIREKLYTALDERGFNSICLFGATDDDIEDLASKTRPNGAQIQIKLGRLSNCSISDRGLEVFLATFGQLEELELTGCNEITNAIDLRGLKQLRRLIITDCINIADGLAQRLAEIFHQLEVLVVQAYHLTDAFLEFISLNADTSRLKRLELPNCKELTQTSALTIAKHFQALDALSLSGSTKINDDAIEILAEYMKSLESLDLGWLKIGDLSLECLACDLRHLRELILDRNVHITDLGLGYLATMADLTLLYVRWCPQLTDKSIRSISNMRSLTRLSLAGLHQITARGILSLIDSQQLEELELTNCPAVTCELQQFLSVKMPNCNIIY